ncbi:MAG: single-stranded DNA-binding protein [Candidatus Cryptobacteroides sp.]
MSLNKVMLIGNVGKEPEIRYIETGSGSKVASFTIATTERYRDKNGETKENTEWHNVVMWRSGADIVEKYVHKGTQIYIEGKLRSRSWTDQSGNKRYTTEVLADSIQLLGRKSDNNSQSGEDRYNGNQYSAPAQSKPQPSTMPEPEYNAPQQQSVEDMPADDLPF